MTEDQYTLSIRDNGIGWPPGFDPHATNSLGMSLMKGLSKQLNGNLRIENGTGLGITLNFKADDLNWRDTHGDEFKSIETTTAL